MVRQFVKQNAAHILCIATFMLATGGCAKLKLLSSKLPDISPEREQRQQRIVEDFARRRDDSQYRAAIAAWERGDAPACEDLLVVLLKRDPMHRDGRLALADLYLEGQSLPAAESHYRQLIEHHPDDAHAHHGLGLLLQQLGRDEEAQPHFAKADTLEPNHPVFVGSNGYPVAAVTDPTAKDGDFAVRLTSAEVRSKTAATDRGKVSVAADGPHTIAKKASDLLRTGQPEAALELAASAADRHPENVALKRLVATAHMQLGDPEAAQVSLRQALSLDKRDALTYFLLGCLLDQQGDSATAQRHFAEARRIDPRLPAHSGLTHLPK